VKFVEHLRGREVQLLVDTANREMSRAFKDQRDRHRMAITAVAAGVIIILGGVITSLAGHVQAGVVSTLSGVVVALIPSLVFRRLDRANLEIKAASPILNELSPTAREAPTECSRARANHAPAPTPTIGPERRLVGRSASSAQAPASDGGPSTKRLRDLGHIVDHVQ
jgi:hypothetical protein